MAVAMGSGQLDLAWMGPWGYIIANNASGCIAIATAKDQLKAHLSRDRHRQTGYRGEVIPRRHKKGARSRSRTSARPPVWPSRATTRKRCGRSTRKSFWKYSEGATHAANEIAVSSGQGGNTAENLLRSQPHRNDRKRQGESRQQQDHLHPHRSPTMRSWCRRGRARSQRSNPEKRSSRRSRRIRRRRYCPITTRGLSLRRTTTMHRSRKRPRRRQDRPRA